MNLLKQKIRKLFAGIKKGIFEVVDFLYQHPKIRLLLVFSFFFICFLSIYFSVATLASGDDHFFHFRFAEEMRVVGVVEALKSFDSIYFSKFAQNQEYFVYYNLLFYLCVIPFTFLQPLFLGIKLYAVVGISLTFSTLYWSLKELLVKRPFMWTIIMFAVTSRENIWRFFLSRPYALAPAFLMLLIVFLHKRKVLPVFLISFAYVFWHSATFYFPILIAACVFVFEKFYQKNGGGRVFLSSCFGVFLGVMVLYTISPGFLLYCWDIIFGIFKDSIIGQSVDIPEGRELYPINILDFKQKNILVFISLLFLTTVEVVRYVFFKKDQVKNIVQTQDVLEERNELRSGLFFLTITFFVGTVFVSQRFDDFFVFFVSLYIPVAFTSLHINFSSISFMVRKAFVTGGIVVFSYFFVVNLSDVQNMLGVGGSTESFAQVGAWLSKNTNKDDIVFYPNWSWFPQLYYHSPQNRYIIGLEPRFLFDYDQRLYWLHYYIAAGGYVCETETCESKEKKAFFAARNPDKFISFYKSEGKDVASILLNEFQAKYVLVSISQDKLLLLLKTSDSFKKVFDDGFQFSIYKVLENN